MKLDSKFDEKWFHKYSSSVRKNREDHDILFLSKTGLVNQQKYFFEYFLKSIKSKENNRKLKVLDVGCGTGNTLKRLSKLGFELYGVDYVEEIIELAKKKNSNENIKFCVADIYNLPFEDNYFDILICDGVFQCISNYSSAIAEMKRVLRSNGLMIITTLNKLSLDRFIQKEQLIRYSPYKLKKDLITSGFREVKINGIYFPPKSLNFLVDMIIKFKLYRLLNKLFQFFVFFSHGIYIESRKN